MSDSTLEENIRQVLQDFYEGIACDIGPEDSNFNVTIPALLSLYQKELEFERDLALGVFWKVAVSNGTGPRTALVWEQEARKRLRGITEPIVIGVDEGTKPDLTGEQP